jgi:hypothetical protein
VNGIGNATFTFFNDFLSSELELETLSEYKPHFDNIDNADSTSKLYSSPHFDTIDNTDTADTDDILTLLALLFTF